jgi:hypothetical protein
MTTYNGYTFFSRLEAQWAVFFNELGIKWMYEYQNVKLPDFFLPDLDVWFDVRATFPDFGAQTKYITLTKRDTHKILFVAYHGVDLSKITCWFAGKHLPSALFMECTKCDRIGFLAGTPERGFCYSLRCEHKEEVVKEGFFAIPARITVAAETARSARFEHGQVGWRD